MLRLQAPRPAALPRSRRRRKPRSPRRVDSPPTSITSARTHQPERRGNHGIASSARRRAEAAAVGERVGRRVQREHCDYSTKNGSAAAPLSPAAARVRRDRPAGRLRSARTRRASGRTGSGTPPARHRRQRQPFTSRSDPASSVSRSSRASATRSSVARLSSRHCFAAFYYVEHLRHLVIVCSVLLAVVLARDEIATERRRRRRRRNSPDVASLMPYLQTMRASSVACLRSFDAPVDSWPERFRPHVRPWHAESSRASGRASGCNGLPPASGRQCHAARNDRHLVNGIGVRMSTATSA